MTEQIERVVSPRGFTEAIPVDHIRWLVNLDILAQRGEAHMEGDAIVREWARKDLA